MRAHVSPNPRTCESSSAVGAARPELRPRSGTLGRGQGRAKSVVPTLLRRDPSGTEKDLFRKHKSYFAHMDDNKAT